MKTNNNQQTNFKCIQFILGTRKQLSFKDRFLTSNNKYIKSLHTNSLKFNLNNDNNLPLSHQGNEVYVSYSSKILNNMRKQLPSKYANKRFISEFLRQSLYMICGSSLFLLITGYTFDNYSGTILNLIVFSPQFTLYLDEYSSYRILEELVITGFKLKDKTFKDLFKIWLYYYVLRISLIIIFDFFGFIYLASLLKITLFNILFPGFSGTILDIYNIDLSKILGDIDIKLRDYTSLILRMEEYLSDTIWWHDSFKVSDTNKVLVENVIQSSLVETKKITVDNPKAKTFFGIFRINIYNDIKGKGYGYYPSAFQKGGLPTILNSIDQIPFDTSKVSLDTINNTYTKKLNLYEFSYRKSLRNNLNLYKECSVKLTHINSESMLNVVPLGKEVVSLNKGDVILLGKKVTPKGDIIPLGKKVTPKGDIGLSYWEQLRNKWRMDDIIKKGIENHRNLIVYTYSEGNSPRPMSILDPWDPIQDFEYTIANREVESDIADNENLNEYSEVVPNIVDNENLNENTGLNIVPASVNTDIVPNIFDNSDLNLILGNHMDFVEPNSDKVLDKGKGIDLELSSNHVSNLGPNIDSDSELSDLGSEPSEPSEFLYESRVERENEVVVVRDPKTCYVKNTADLSKDDQEYANLKLAVESIGGLKYSTARSQMQKRKGVVHDTYEIYVKDSNETRVERINYDVVPHNSKICYVKNTADLSNKEKKYTSLRLAVESIEGLSYSTAVVHMSNYNVVVHDTYEIYVKDSNETRVESIKDVVPYNSKPCYIIDTADLSNKEKKYTSLRQAVETIEGLNYETAKVKMRSDKVVVYGTSQIFLS